jgi:hypothetical protein
MAPFVGVLGMTEVRTEVAGQGSAGKVSAVDFVALKPGQTIGRYEVLAILGQGGFGITYRARDSQLGREVAIKEYLPAALAVRHDGMTVLPRSTAAAEDFTWGRERFVAEGRTLASLQDAPAIVRVFDFLEVNGTAYIVMQLLQGETLEARIKRTGPLGPTDIDRILWPLLDGLEQVHNAGFLHRDIKPGNILMDAGGQPTLIDFGASRAAIAGRSHALTAIFTPGYAAAEQMTAAKQGPWTDIYGVAATVYNAITGKVPPSAFDRMLEDTYEPLGRMELHGFAPGLLVGIDAGLAVRATDRPQAIAGWRAILGQATAPDAQATITLARAITPEAATARVAPVHEPPLPSAGAAPPARKRAAVWIGAVAVLLLAAGGGAYSLIGAGAPAPAPPQPVAKAPAPVDKAAEDAQAAAEAQRLKDQQELARLRAEAAAREKAEQEAALRKQIEEETRQKLAAEAAEKQRIEDEARQKAEAEAAAQRKAEEAKKKPEEDKAKADAAAKAATPATAPPAASAANPQQAAVAPRSGPDGVWQGILHCTPSRIGNDFSISLMMTITNGAGTWVRGGTSETGTHSVSLIINGSQVQVARVFTPNNHVGRTQTATMHVQYDGANAISGGGPEANSGGRNCDINMRRVR